MKKKTAKRTAEPKAGPGISTRSSLADVLHDLERINREWHELGLSPISYGTYVAQLEGRK